MAGRNNFASAIGRIRDRTADTPAEELFDLILDLAEFVASREHLINRRGRDLEPDVTARWLFADPQAAGIKGVGKILDGLTIAELGVVEDVLHELEREHGRVQQTPPNHRLLVDGAVLGNVGFVYNRKFREVLAAVSAGEAAAPFGLLEHLTARVDDVLTIARPRLLWRLGPELGTDRNVAHLLRRGDSFVMRSLYGSRARTLARRVRAWEPLPQDGWIGESTGTDRHGLQLRTLVVRNPRNEPGTHSLLLTNLFNLPWEEVHRLYRNRSGKLAAGVTTQQRRHHHARQAVAVSVLAFALFVYRNADSWAHAQEVPIGTHPAAQECVVPTTSSLYTTVYVPEVGAVLVDHLREVVTHLQQTIGPGNPLTDIDATDDQLAYLVTPAAATVTTHAGGTVLFVERDAPLSTVTIYHGNGLSTTYRDLALVPDVVRVGAELADGAEIGSPGNPDGSFRFVSHFVQSFGEKLVEPSVSEVLNPQRNQILDPLGVLVTDGELSDFAVVDYRLIEPEDVRVWASDRLDDERRFGVIYPCPIECRGNVPGELVATSGPLPPDVVDPSGPDDVVDVLPPGLS